MLRHAQSRGTVSQNAALAVKTIKANPRDKKKLEIGVDIPTAEEIKAIIAAAGRSRPLLLTAIFAGLRSSELRGLRWTDIDFKRGVLKVGQRADRYGVIGKPKSKAGHRTVPIGPQVINALREWKLACPKGEHGLLFPTPSGDIALHNNVVRAFTKTVRTAGLKFERRTEVHRPTCTTSLLCIVVHQPGGSRRTRLAAEGGATTAWTFINHHDNGHVRSLIPGR